MVSIAPQVFDILEYLIRYRERVVSKDDLIDFVWKGRIISDAAFSTRLNVVRRAIGDSGCEQHLIKTLPRKGLRFVGTVSEDQETAGTAAADVSAPQPNHARPLPGKPSIVVLPFVNMSCDPDYEHFADGMVEDIIIGLSRFKSLSIVPRHSSFSYKGKVADVMQVRRELGVRYILEGSVRKSGGLIRIGARLVDAEKGSYLWVNTLNGAHEAGFDLQDRVTASAIGAIAPTVLFAEMRRAGSMPIENLSARDHYLRGSTNLDLGTRDGNKRALNHFRKSIGLDPNMAAAYAMAAWCYVVRKVHGWMDDSTDETDEASRLARTALRLGNDRSLALCMGGYVLGFLNYEFDDAAAFIDRSLVINPNSTLAWTLSAWVRVWRGEPGLAIEHAGNSERLSPLDPSKIQAAAAYAHFLLHRYKLASSLAEQARRRNPNFTLSAFICAASNALAGRPEIAQQAVAGALECDRTLRVSNLNGRTPFRKPQDFALFLDGIEQAGLPS